MAATPLTAQECFLLERYTSLEYYGRMRDAWEAVVLYTEGLLERYVQHLPDGYRNRPLPKQPDIVWGERVLPNFRDAMQSIFDGYIQFSHGDWSGWSGVDVSNCVRGASDFWHGWMDEAEEGGLRKYSELLGVASDLASNIDGTADAGWPQDCLGKRYRPDIRGPLTPPLAWPRYRLNPDILVKTDEPVQHAGLYWPEAEEAAVQFLIPTTEKMDWVTAPPALVGLSKSGVQYDHKEPTVWIKVERIPGETVDDGLADLLATTTLSPRNVAGGKPCPRTGWWFTPAQANGQRRHFRKGEVFPVIKGSHYGDTFWQWSPDQSEPRL